MSAAAGTGAGRFALAGGWLAALLAGGHFVNDVFTGMLPALLPTLQDRFALTETKLALLVAVFSFSTSVPQPLLGALADRLGRRAVTSLGVVLSAVLLSLVGVSPSVPLLFLLLAVAGLGSAALHPAGSTLAGGLGGPNKGLAISLFTAGGMVGYAVGPVLILWVVARFGLGATPWMMIPGILLGTLVYLGVPPQSRNPTAHPRVLDAQLVTGPVGMLSLAGIFSHLPMLAFTSAIPLWLVLERGLPRDSALLGWTLAAFSVAAGLGGVVAAALERWVGRRVLVPGSMLLSLIPLYAVFALKPGTPLFFGAVVFAGALVYASLPLMVVSAQELAPDAESAAAGMIIGLTAGLAGVLYVGIGRLQEVIGIAPALRVSYLTLLPAAVLAFVVLTRHQRADTISPGAGCATRSGRAPLGRV